MKLYKHYLILLLTATSAPAVLAYAPDQHQALTFIAAKATNRCLEDSELPRLSALQVRYIVRANVSLADSNFFVRMFRWNYYNRSDAGERTVMGVFDTRLHEHFNELVLRLESEESLTRRYADLGRVVSYLQDVTTPSRAVPVYTNRFWRLSFSDRFDHYPVDVQAVEAALAGSCAFVLSAERDLDRLLLDTATGTIQAVRSPIFGMPVTWEAFWQLADDDADFGEYGPAGNLFGRETEFRCAQDAPCVLLDEDPLYRDFAVARHVAAVLATMRALVLMQQAELQVAPTSSPDP